MVIDGIDIYWVRIPLAFVWRTSYADQHYTDTILLKMQSQGLYAWGESCPPYIPAYSSEHTLATFHTLREHMATRVVGHDIRSAHDLLDRIAFVKGNQFARAALEITWWVLEARRQGVPLHAALGGTGDRVAVGADFGIQDSLDVLMQKIQGAIDQGFPRIKLKFRPGWDLDMVDAVRSTFPGFTFHVDCNAAYTLADADLFRALDRYRLAMIEQPLADDGKSLVDHADLQARIETPICLDESALQGRQHQDGPRRRADGLARDPGAVRAARHPVLGGRHARERHRRRDLRRAGDLAELHLSRRHLPIVVLLPERPRQARDRSQRRRRGRHLTGARHSPGARSRSAQAVDRGSCLVPRISSAYQWS
jgi:o-succinylbenzoate synthase